VGGRTLGYSLLGGAALLAVLMIAWLAVSGAAGGGIVLGLILMVVLAGPLAIGGLVVLSRQSAEAAAAAEFANKQRILDSDRLFRRELAPELRQVARQSPALSTRLEDLAEDLERSTHDSAEWYDAVQLEAQDAATLKRYEDLVWDRLRLLRERANASAPPAELDQSARDLERAIDQWRDLLVRGRRAPEVAPSELVRSGTPARGIEALRNLSLRDAVTHDGIDYVVEGVATYFAEGQTWKLVHLSPADTGTAARWLYVGPAALEVALLDETAASPDMPQAATGTATVDVSSAAGAARGVLVSFRRFGAGEAVAFTEEWPDGARHTYVGKLIRPTDIDVWPASAPTMHRDG
jgi:hypothetical protein